MGGNYIGDYERQMGILRQREFHRNAARQQAALGGLAGLSGLGQAFNNGFDIGEKIKSNPKPKTLKDELQDEINEWLEDV